jgi:hypothetical protein
MGRHDLMPERLHVLAHNNHIPRPRLSQNFFELFQQVSLSITSLPLPVLFESKFNGATNKTPLPLPVRRLPDETFDAASASVTHAPPHKQKLASSAFMYSLSILFISSL